MLLSDEGNKYFYPWDMLIVMPAMQAEFLSAAYRKACQICVSDSFQCSLLQCENIFKIKMTMLVRMNFDSSIMKCVGGSTQSADFGGKFNSTSSPARCGIEPRTFSTSSNSVQSNSCMVRIIPSGACSINTPGFSPSVVMYA